MRSGSGALSTRGTNISLLVIEYTLPDPRLVYIGEGTRLRYLRKLIKGIFPIYLKGYGIRSCIG